MIYPEKGNCPLPNQDLESEIQEDYLEARSIINKSPRGAAALFRLCLQKLCKQLGQPGKNINTDIAALVQDGLNPKVQKALDSVRVIGNEAVHPGTLDLKDNSELASKLANLINFIAETMITNQNEIDSIYNSLPVNKKEQIEKRDTTT